MQNNDLIKKAITIVNTEKKTLESGIVIYSIYDQDDVKYTFFKTKKDGSESKAYQTFKQLGVEPEGKQVGIAYAETQKEFDGKTVTFRNIRWIDVSILDNETLSSEQEEEIASKFQQDVRVEDIPF